MGNKIKVTHHIVYSTKGGCGKTAFSLFLALCNKFPVLNSEQLEKSKHLKEDRNYRNYIPVLDDSPVRDCFGLAETNLENLIKESNDRISKDTPLLPILREQAKDLKKEYESLGGEKALNGNSETLKKKEEFIARLEKRIACAEAAIARNKDSKIHAEYLITTINDKKKDIAKLNKTKKKIVYEKTANYLIDLDLLGSSLEYSLRINKEDYGEKIYYEGKHSYADEPTFQKLVDNKKHIGDVKDWIANSTIEFNRGKGEKVFIIPVDASEKEKIRFHVKKGMTPLLRYEELEKQLGGLQDSIILKHNPKKHDEIQQVNHIHLIYDLPPNADSYTDAVFSEIFKRAGKNGKNKEQEDVILYLVSNCQPMLNCNLDWLAENVCAHEDRECPVILVNNDNVESLESVYKLNSSMGTKLLDPTEDSLSGLRLNKSVIELIRAHWYFHKDTLPMRIFKPQKSQELQELQDSRLGTTVSHNSDYFIERVIKDISSRFVFAEIKIKS